jgi:phospholipid/cholesterol/gamma-HCH transport system substrate-binding protein
MTKNNNLFEVIVGTIVLLSAILFFTNSFKSAKKFDKKGYNLIAKFDNVDGIAIGSDVKISGVKIGSVEDQFLDQESFKAVLKIKVNNDIKLPDDSSAKIASEGLLGSKYLSIEVGSSEDFLAENNEIIFTQSSVNLEDLLGKFIFSSSSDSSKNSSKDSTKK